MQYSLTFILAIIREHLLFVRYSYALQIASTTGKLIRLYDNRGLVSSNRWKLEETNIVLLEIIYE